MNPLRALLLGLLQGITEFVPVSSSGHLVLVPWLLGWSDPGLAFDTMVHWGTLLAVVVYFWRDLFRLSLAWVRGWGARSWHEPEGHLAWLLLLGTVPAAAAGALLEQRVESLLAAPTAVAGLLVVTGVLLALGELLARHKNDPEDLAWQDALLIGIGQAAAIAPGISRSGATMVTGLLGGLKREAAARFSFLLATPVILGAGAMQLARLVASPPMPTQWVNMGVGFVASALSGYLCIRFLMGYLRRRSLYPFAVYCCAAGAAFLVLSQAPASSAGVEPLPTPSEITLAGPQALRPLMQDLSRAYESRTPGVTVLLAEEAASSYDLALSYEPPQEAYQIPVALDALTIVVNPDNPVAELGMLQVQDIFAGRVHSWDAFGGPPEEIVPLDQMDGTPSRTAFVERVMKTEATTPNARVVPYDAAAAAEVAADPWAISYVAVGYVSPQVRAVAIEGTAPSPENLARGAYPLLRPVYLTAPHQPLGEAQNLAGFTLDEAGQATVGQRYGRVEVIRE